MHHTVWSQLYNELTFVHLAMSPNSHTHHNFDMCRHYYCAIMKEIQCFQLILNTFKMVCYDVIYAAFHVTHTCESYHNSRVLVFVV